MKKLLGIAVTLIILFTFVGCMTSEPASSSGASSGTATSDGEKAPAKAEESTSYEITDSRITVWNNSIGTTWMTSSDVDHFEVIAYPTQFQL